MVEAEQRTDGRQLVGALLMDRCAEAGMVRPKGMTLEEFDAFRARLLNRLAYMAAANLRTLAEIVIEGACGPKRNQWPAEASVIGWANVNGDPKLDPILAIPGFEAGDTYRVRGSMRRLSWERGD